MTERRQSLFWHRAGPLALLAAAAMAGEGSQGCGGGSGGTGGTGTGGTSTGGTSTGGSTTSSSSNTTSTSSSNTTSTSSSNTTSTTSSSDGGIDGGMTLMGTATAAANAMVALDATPDPTGATLYFTAYDPTLGPGVFSVPADGSNPTPVTVKAGAPFAAPFGIATSTDGSQLYVADPGATDTTSNQDLGVIFALPKGGGTPTIVAGTALTEARGLEVLSQSGADVIFFTGRDKTTGLTGVFSVPAAGGTLTTVAEGAPFNDPSGIAVAADGTIFVADTVASASHLASIIKVSGGTAIPIVNDLRVGYPAGLALTEDGSTLLLSSRDPATATDVILQIVLATLVQTPIAPASITSNTEGAGLHRAKSANVFAFVDSSAGPAGGTVYTVK